MNVNASVSYGSVSGFAAAAVVAAIVISLQGATAGAAPITQTVAPGTASASFANVPPDTYTVTATPVDEAANPLTATGYTVPSTSVTVTAPSTVTLSVPTGITATAA